MDTATVDNPKKPKRSPTVKQRRVLSLLLDNAGNPKPESVRQLMLRAGYSPSAADNPARTLLNAPSFQDLLALINEDELLAKVREIALDDDKRASLAAIDMLLKLKDRYPANKLKLQGYQDELADLTETESPALDPAAPSASAL